MNIISPMATGNGAYIVHKILEKYIPQYIVKRYNPYLTLFPFILKPGVRITKNADLIHTSPDYAYFFNKKSIPLIITFHNYVLDVWMKQYSSFLQNIHYKTDLRLFTKLAVQHAHTITAVSRYTAEIIKKDMKVSKPIKVIYNGVDTDLFTPQNHKNNNKIKVFFSGNLTRRKGAQWLPDIASLLKKNITIYYTKGLQTKNSLISCNNLKTIGNIPYSKMPDIYRKMDILIMPSIREGFGLAVAEAMACGLPVVASDCSAIPELIDNNKGGFLCRIGDTNEFANKINILAESSLLRKDMGEYNRSKIEKSFTVKKMINEYNQLFNRVLS